jgi:medium-chain acyl-[acyl-carrier-protein] hydrolase
VTKPNSDNRWIAYRKPNPAARLRLFCFHYAGGGASVFRDWQSSVPAAIEICPVQLPGRESRLRDPALTRVGPIIDTLPGVMEHLFDLPFAFFGHSMGTILSHELALRLRALGKPEPVHLLLSARRAPHRPEKDKPIHDLPEEEFKHELRELDGTPEAVLEHPELMELLSPVLRADFAVCETHVHTPEAPLATPISVFGGLGDEKVDRQDLEEWRQYTSGSFKMRMFAGNHFFLQGTAKADLLRCLCEDLAASTGLLGS